MTRYLWCLAALAVAALPDWASALCPPRRFAFVAPLPAAYPVQLVFVPSCLPVYEVPLPPPRVDPPAVKPPAVGAAPRPPMADPVRPATAVEPARPTPAPAPPPDLLPAPRPEPVTPPAPKVMTPTPPTKVEPPSLTIPLRDIVPPQPAPVDPPSPVVPPPAPPAPDAGLLIPPPSLRLPVPPADTPAAGGAQNPPSLVLPPVTAPPPAPVIAKSSPVSDVSNKLRVQAIPVVAAGPVTGETRKVGFYNHSDRNVVLVVNGETATLPRGYYLKAELPASFEYRLGAAAAERVTVPDGQAGVELVIRD